MWVPNRDRLPHHDRAVGQSLVKCLYILKYLEISWNVLKCLEISWNILKCLEISWNILKYLEISWNILKYLEMSWNILKCLEMSWNVLKYLEIHRISMILYDFVTSSSESNVLTSLSIARSTLGFFGFSFLLAWIAGTARAIRPGWGAPGQCCVQLPYFGGWMNYGLPSGELT